MTDTPQKQSKETMFIGQQNKTLNKYPSYPSNLTHTHICLTYMSDGSAYGRAADLTKESGLL